MRSAASVAAVLFVFCLVAGAADAASGPDIPSVFARTAVPADHLPAAFQRVHQEGSQPFDSRRIATYRDKQGRAWSVYVFKEIIRKRTNICVFTLRGAGGGGGCTPSTEFFAPGRWVVATEGRLMAGVAADNVSSIRLIGSRGVVHAVRLSRDRGFIYDCNAYNGCSCLIARLQAFDSRGRLVSDQDWLSSSCRRR